MSPKPDKLQYYTNDVITASSTTAQLMMKWFLWSQHFAASSNKSTTLNIFDPFSRVWIFVYL